MRVSRGWERFALDRLGLVTFYRAFRLLAMVVRRGMRRDGAGLDALGVYMW